MLEMRHKLSAMRKSFYILLFSLVFTGCYAPQQAYKLEPDAPAHSFWQNGTQYIWDNEDSVIVSMGFKSIYPNEVVMDVGVDNRSQNPVIFDPSLVYLFRYESDTSEPVHQIYYATDPVKQEDSLTHSIEHEKKKITGNVVFSVILGAAYIATELATDNAESPRYVNHDALGFTHAVIQSGLANAREESMENIDEMNGDIKYWQKGVLNKSTVNPGSYEQGMVHFKVPDSPYYKVYMHLGDRVYCFAFKRDVVNQGG